MNEPYFDFGHPRPDLRPVTIRTSRPLLLRQIGEEKPRHVDAGSVVTIALHDLGPLTYRHDYEVPE